MILERGDWDNLEGRVIIYSRFNNLDTNSTDNKSDLFFASYAAIDINIFCNKMGIPKSSVKKSSMGSENCWKSKKPALYIAKGVYHDKKDFLKGDDDRLYVNRFSRIETLNTAVCSSIQYYFNLFDEQAAKKKYLPSPLLEALEHNYPKKYGEIDKEFRHDYMMAKFIRPMIVAANAQDHVSLSGITINFLRFADDSRGRVKEPILDLSSNIKKQAFDINVNYLNLTVAKINFLMDEDYELMFGVINRLSEIKH